MKTKEKESLILKDNQEKEKVLNNDTVIKWNCGERQHESSVITIYTGCQHCSCIKGFYVVPKSVFYSPDRVAFGQEVIGLDYERFCYLLKFLRKHCADSYSNKATSLMALCLKGGELEDENAAEKEEKLKRRTLSKNKQIPSMSDY